ncbi:MAG: MXAN_6640 family putative metalloprotease, partial [candidate division WOR-3 bacterium]
MKIRGSSFIFFLMLLMFIKVNAEVIHYKCGTPEALEAYRQGIKFVRPSNGPNYIYTTHFIIHYDINNTTTAYAESVAKYAEYSWAKQVDTLKWAAPPPDGTNGGDSRYDIYVRNISYLGVTTTEASYSTPYQNGATSYIQIDNEISPYGLLQVTVAHEFNHACQFRYSYLENTFWYENTATWMEDVCYDNVNDYVNYLYSTPNPLDSTHLPITSNRNLYWYAGAIWAMFLQEYFNDSCPRFCWEKMGEISGENTLSGIDYVLTNKFSSSLMFALKQYAIWRYFTGSRADAYHFSESNSWPTSALLRTHNTYPASGNQSPFAPSGPGGTNYIRFTSGSNALSVIFDGQDGYTWSAYLIGYRNPSQSIEQEFSLNSVNCDTLEMSWSGNSAIVLIPVVTQWSSSANNLIFTYNASQIIYKDVGVTAIEVPTGTIESTGAVIPRAKVKNFGSDSITFQVTFKIGGIYSSSRTKKLNAGIEDTVNFAPWSSPRGTYTVRCSTYVTGDVNHSNDTLSNSVTVLVNDVGVTAITSPPDTIYRGSLQPKATVKNYGTQPATFYTYFKILDLVGNQVYLDSSLVSSLNPNASSTRTFKAFLFQVGKYQLRCSTALANDLNPINDVKLDSVVVLYIPAWIRKRDMPLGLSNKYVKAGGALTVGVGDKIYAFKGNNTNEFYVYDIAQDTWITLESIPYNPLYRKRVNRGAALAYNKHYNPDIIYAIKGNNTLEFWAYNVEQDTWIRKTDVPVSTTYK